MTINELHIRFDLQPENKINVLNIAASKCSNGYLFVDSSDGHYYLFDENGNEDDIKKIKRIENYIFWNCENLISIVIPDSVKRIGDYVFGHCKNLKSIVIPNSVKSIGDAAFTYCKNLKSIVIPDSVESIEDYVFWGCENLKLITIPDSVEWIGYDAFWNCKSLKSLTFKGKTMKQVKEMEKYPFGVKDESIIRCV